MKEIENKHREYVEAVPGPAIVISKETYKKMEENNNAKQNQKRLKKYEKFLKRINIKDETKTSENEELTL